MAWSDAARQAAAEARSKGAHAQKVNNLPSKQTPNSHELRLFGDNDAQLYRSSKQPIEANLSKKMANGTYDHDKAVKLWGFHADRAAQSYAKQFGTPDQKWHQMFSPSDRRAAAQSWATSFRDEHR